MYTFNKLRKAVKQKKQNELKQYKLAVLGDTATQLLVTALEGYGVLQKLDLRIYEAEYNQVMTEIIDENSGLYQFKPDYVLLYMSSEKVYEEFCKIPQLNRENFAENYIERLKEWWNKINLNMSCKIIQCNFAENSDNVFGQYGNKVLSSYTYQLRKLNYLLMEAAACFRGTYICDVLELQNQIGRDRVFSEKYYYSARLSVNMDILPYVAKLIIDIIQATQGKIKKCVVLDLDNTLWGGVIGDDGIDNIEIGELGEGRAFTDFQIWLKQLKERGILLAVCSKNNEDIAKEPFEKHPDMALRLEDFVVFVANWDDKASNINYIQQVLNIGMDSIIFIDDNPFERNLVRQMLPEVTVPELPEDPSKYVTFLKSENLFETASYSREDTERVAQYQAEAERVKLQSNYSSLEDYLISLEMIGEANAFDSFHIPRIAQLTQRSNQFNLRTVRYTEKEIEDIANSDRYITLYFTLKDKFGDHGLISVVIMEKKEEMLFVNTWLMSCRVLKRTVEEYVINTMITTAREQGYKKIVGEYIPTPKNSMVKDIYERMGFKNMGENKYEMDVNSFELIKCYINL